MTLTVLLFWICLQPPTLLFCHVIALPLLGISDHDAVPVSIGFP